MLKIIGILFTLGYVATIVFQCYCLFSNIEIALEEYDHRCGNDRVHQNLHGRFTKLSDPSHSLQPFPSKIRLMIEPNGDRGDHVKPTGGEYGVTCSSVSDEKDLLPAEEGGKFEESKKLKSRSCDDGSEPILYFVIDVNATLLCCHSPMIPNRSENMAKLHKNDVNNVDVTALNFYRPTMATPTEENDIAASTTFGNHVTSDHDTSETDAIADRGDNLIQSNDHSGVISNDAMYTDVQSKSTPSFDVIEPDFKDGVPRLTNGGDDILKAISSSTPSKHYGTIATSGFSEDSKHEMNKRHVKVVEDEDELNRRKEENIDKKGMDENSSSVTESEIVIHLRLDDGNDGKGIVINSDLLDEKTKKDLLSLSERFLAAGHGDDSDDNLDNDTDLKQRKSKHCEEADDTYFYTRLAILAQIIAMLGLALTTFVCYQLGVRGLDYSSQMSLVTLITVCVGFLSAVAWSKSTGQKFESSWEYWPYFCCYFYALVAAIVLLANRLINYRQVGYTFYRRTDIERGRGPPVIVDRYTRAPDGCNVVSVRSWNIGIDEDEGLESGGSSPMKKPMPNAAPCDEATSLLTGAHPMCSDAKRQNYGAGTGTVSKDENVTADS